MGRKLEIPDHVSAALHQWGAWARRPQFWVDLRATSFYRLLRIGPTGKVPEIELDAQSLKIHRAVMRLENVKMQVVLYAYYVAQVMWSERGAVFIRYGISRRSFQRFLKLGSLATFNGAK